jgi:hypothetical protein
MQGGGGFPGGKEILGAVPDEPDNTVHSFPAVFEGQGGSALFYGVRFKEVSRGHSGFLPAPVTAIFVFLIWVWVWYFRSVFFNGGKKGHNPPQFLLRTTVKAGPAYFPEVSGQAVVVTGSEYPFGAFADYFGEGPFAGRRTAGGGLVYGYEVFLQSGNNLVILIGCLDVRGGTDAGGAGQKGTVLIIGKGGVLFQDVDSREFSFS